MAEATAMYPHVIVVGNEKGGCGKTTLSLHIVMSLLHKGYRVATVDLDVRQRSFTQFLQNRRDYAMKHKINLPFPQHFLVHPSEHDSKEKAETEESERFAHCVEKAGQNCDVLLVDSPGSDSYLSRVAHSYADTIITPINDSFVDLSVIADIDEKNYQMKSSGIYSAMVWEAKKQKASRSLGEIQWVVLRNRLSTLDARNKRHVHDALQHASNRLGFLVADGLCERVIYREMYLKGLSLPDLLHEKIDIPLRIGHVGARQELREFIEFLKKNTALDVVAPAVEAA